MADTEKDMENGENKIVTENEEMAQVGNNILNLPSNYFSEKCETVFIDDKMSGEREGHYDSIAHIGSEEIPEKNYTNLETIVAGATTIKSLTSGNESTNYSKVIEDTYYTLEDDPEITFNFKTSESVTPSRENIMKENMQKECMVTADCFPDEDMYGDTEGVLDTGSPSMDRVENSQQVNFAMVATLMQTMQNEINVFMINNKNDTFIEMANNRNLTLTEIHNVEVKMIGNAKEIQSEVKNIEIGLQNEIKGSQIGLQNEIRGVQQNMRSVEHKIHSMEGNFQKVFDQHTEKTEDNINTLLKQNRVDLGEQVQYLEDRLVKQQNINFISYKEQAEVMSAAVNIIKENIEVLMGTVIQLKHELEVARLDLSQVKGELHEERLARENQVGQLSEKVTRDEGTILKLQEELQRTNERLKLLNECVKAQVTTLPEGLPNVVGVLIEPIRDEVKTLSLLVSDLQNKQANIDLRCETIEVAVVATTTQSNELNNHLHLIEGQIDRVGSSFPESVKAILTQVLGQHMPVGPPLGQQAPSPNMVNNRANVTPLQNISNIHSIPLSPLLADSFVTPTLPQKTPEVATNLGNDNNPSRSHNVIMEIVKKNKRPSFSGDNVSPPLFLQEVEAFFALININNDKDKLQVFPTFLSGNPANWWMIVSEQVTSWETAKDIFLRQYFNEYEKQKYKQEWHDLDFVNFTDLEQFTLRGLQILNTIKIESAQKKCERITVKLPEPLRDYLLNRQFTSTQDFLNQIKEAMRLKNFDFKNYVKTVKSNKSGNNANSNNLNQNLKANNQWGNNNNLPNKNPAVTNNFNDQQNNGNTQVVMNPNYRGSSKNYDPNYRGSSKNYDPNYRNRFSYNSTPQKSMPSTGNFQGYNNSNGYRNNGNNGYTNNGRGQNASRSYGNNQRGSGRSNGRTNPPGNGNSPSRSNPPQLGVSFAGMTTPNFQNHTSTSAPSTTPSSPPINNYYFSFTPDMLEAVLRQTQASGLTSSQAGLNTPDEDTTENANQTNC